MGRRASRDDDGNARHVSSGFAGRSTLSATESTGAPPKWTGWYYDMFEDREISATKNASFVADYFTLTNEGEVRYLGADTPRLGVFLVDSAASPGPW